MKITESMRKVLEYLNKNYDEGYVSPTQIGTALVSGHSAWASPRCLKLVEAGLIRRNKKGWYRIKREYRISATDNFKPRPAAGDKEDQN